MRTIRVTMQETVTYEFEIEVEDDFEVTGENVAAEAEEVFVNFEAGDMPPVTVNERDLIFWEEV
jgi:hypothetical protein